MFVRDTVRSWALPPDWPFTDAYRTPRRFIRQNSDGDDKGGDKGGQKDAAYWEAEAKKAFEARDEVKRKLRDLEGKVLSDEDRALFDRLKTEHASLEEQRKRAEGKFDELRNELVTKHQTELQERDSKLSTLSQRMQNMAIRAEFGAATDYFGGHDQAKTILDVDLGIAALGKYVKVEDDDTDPRGYRIVVQAPNGKTIIGSDGNPKPFAEAIGELITLLPNKDRILRGSGKTGSGSSGGSSTITGPAALDDTIRKASQGDKDAIKALRERRPAGGMVQGAAWEKKGA